MIDAMRGNRRNPFQVARWAMLGVFAFVASVGCRQILGLDDRQVTKKDGGNGGGGASSSASTSSTSSGGGSGGATACATYKYKVPDCDKCMERACDKEQAACSCDKSCNPVYACLASCKVDDVSCRIECEMLETKPSRGAALDALLACRDRACAMFCSDCGGLADSLGATCQECVDNFCCSPFTTCAESADCGEPLGCGLRCTDPSCELACAGSDLADARYQDVAICAVGLCDSECNFGGHFDCAGAYTWPGGAPTTLEIKLTLVDNSTKDPVDGAVVIACEGVDPCPQGSPSSPTSASGLASFKIPDINPTAGFQGHLEIKDGGTHLSTYIYPGRPILANLTTTYSILTPADLRALITGATPVAGKGSLLVVGEDCLTAPGPNLTFHTSPMSGTSFYITGSTGSTMATKTNAYGAGGFLNVKPGALTVTMTTDNAKQVGSAGVFIVHDSLTILTLYPETATP
jgi:hypothetical protein